MPHQVHLRTLGRTADHRLSMLRNLAVAVVRYERVKTTEAKAKEVRRLVDRAINLGRQGTLVARRRALALLRDPLIVEKAFDDLAKRHADRASGFTRLVRLGHRVGDGAPMMAVELVEGEAKAEAEKAAPKESGPRPGASPEPSEPKGPVARARELARRATGRGAPTAEEKQEKKEDRPGAARKPRAKSGRTPARGTKRAASGEGEAKPKSPRGKKKE